VFGEGLDCSDPLEHYYQTFTEYVIAEWKREDREERSRLWKIEKRMLHALPKLLKRGRFDSIAREQYLADRSVFRILGIGVNAFTQQRVAQVEITSLEKIVWVGISGVKLSKNKLRKLTRRPRGELPDEIYDLIQKRIGCYLH